MAGSPKAAASADNMVAGRILLRVSRGWVEWWLMLKIGALMMMSIRKIPVDATSSYIVLYSSWCQYYQERCPLSWILCHLFGEVCSKQGYVDQHAPFCGSNLRGKTSRRQRWVTVGGCAYAPGSSTILETVLYLQARLVVRLRVSNGPPHLLIYAPSPTA